MTIKIRRGVFETNSSSSHSVSICNNDLDNLMDISLIPDENGVVTIVYLQVYDNSRDDVILRNAVDKAMYVFSDILSNYYEGEDLLIRKELTKSLISIIKKQTGATSVKFRYNKWMYDHLEADMSGDTDPIYNSEESMRNFIFNKNSQVTIFPPF